MLGHVGKAVIMKEEVGLLNCVEETLNLTTIAAKKQIMGKSMKDILLKKLLFTTSAVWEF
jgi:hypothetical protein